PAHQVEKRGFARAALSEEDHELPRLKRRVDAAQHGPLRFPLPVGFGDGAKRDQRRHVLEDVTSSSALERGAAPYRTPPRPLCTIRFHSLRCSSRRVRRPFLASPDATRKRIEREPPLRDDEPKA